MIPRTLFRHVVCSTMMLTCSVLVQASFVTTRMSQRVCRTSKRHWAQDYDYDEFQNDTLLRTALGRAMKTIMSTRANAAASEEATESLSAVESILEHVATTLDSKNNESNRKQLHQSLRLSTTRMLGTAMGRAMRTLATTTNAPFQQNDMKDSNVFSNDGTKLAQEHQKQPPEQIDNYLTNPSITPTALAHSLWSHILRPNVDTAIDATCGNGHDSVAIASILFTDTNSSNSTSSGASTPNQSQLICIDISKKACETTRNRLVTLGYVTDNYNDNDDDGQTLRNHHVTICHTSHSPLPLHLVRYPMNIGLVCYNLGYLPNNNNDNKVVHTTITQMNATISSMTDAILMLRVGGMLSVITYPRTNRNEDYAVHAFLEGLALLSSNDGIDHWREYVKDLSADYPEHKKETNKSSDGELLYTVRDTVRTALERIVEHYSSAKENNGPSKQTYTTTWRVMEHKLLGRALSPILLTAVRIR